MTPSRGNWNSRFGFVLAAAGSAIGLGNIWRFPYTAGENGGGAFVLVYLGFVVLIGLPVLLAELAVGRSTQESPVSAFKQLVPGTLWPLVGGLGVLTGFGILSFYSVIAGATVSYVGLAIKGTFSGPLDAAGSAAIFGQVTSSSSGMIGMTLVFLLATALIVRLGVSGGIERASRVLMPTFFVFLLLLVLRAVTLSGGGAGLEFFLTPDFSALTLPGVVSALGQALFSLSLGMGAMITYGSYLSKDENIPVSAVSVALFDTAIAILGGLIVFPTLFHAQADPSGGPGLVFIAMASIFNELPLGGLFAVGFYLLLAIAALTSTISLLEVIVSYFVDDRDWPREKAVWTVTVFTFLLAVPSALSLGAHEGLSALYSGGGFLDLANTVFGTYCLAIGAMLTSLFVGWKWGIPKALRAIEEGGHSLPMAAAWSFLIRFVCPLAVIVLLVWATLRGANW